MGPKAFFSHRLGKFIDYESAIKAPENEILLVRVMIMSDGTIKFPDMEKPRSEWTRAEKEAYENSSGQITPMIDFRKNWILMG